MTQYLKWILGAVGVLIAALIIFLLSRDPIPPPPQACDLLCKSNQSPRMIGGVCTCVTVISPPAENP